MPLAAGVIVELDIEKPAAGGRMIARHEGQVVLVRGAIPGERVRARIEKADSRLAFASALQPLVASPDRREPEGDPLCGGCVWNHIAYARQVTLKAEILADAFTRIGRLDLPVPPRVAPSPERGYRMRARFHVRGETAGFFREGTHTLCDAAVTRQLLPQAVMAAQAAARALFDAGASPTAIELSENIDATERAVHVDLGSAHASESALRSLVDAGLIRGATARTPEGDLLSVGEASVSDAIAQLTGGRATSGRLARSPQSFFQANRYLLPALVQRVLDLVPPGGPILDLYAGVGLFSVALAACGRARITAVEGDRASGRDLKQNVIPWFAVRPHVGPVEAFLAGSPEQARTILVDPPRTGMSREAIERIARHGAEAIVYISCDPPTLARDARRLAPAGYGLRALYAFDLFPNTPHVESVGEFTAGGK